MDIIIRKVIQSRLPLRFHDTFSGLRATGPLPPHEDIEPDSTKEAFEGIIMGWLKSLQLSFEYSSGVSWQTHQDNLKRLWVDLVQDM